ncbi:MAG: hypothetical protein WDW36_002474 [Sanguina aurantia]
MTGGETDSDETRANDDDAIRFQSMTNAQITDQLLVLLGEGPSNWEQLHKFVAKLGTDAIRDDLAAAQAAHASGQDVWKDKEGKATPRSLGGIFIKLCKRRTARGAVEHAWHHSSGNHIIVAPTGSGKTAIFVELARRRLTANRNSKILVLVPTVNLTLQHYHQFCKAGFAESGWPVKYCSSDCHMSADDYSGFLHGNSVLIAVHQCFLNLLTCNPPEAAVSEFDLLILDECHHTKKEHPYSMILSTYNKTLNPRTQLLGFTASPAGHTDKASLEVKMFALKKRLCAELYVIKEGDSEVQEAAPSPDEIDKLVPRRPVDRDMETNLHSFFLLGCSIVGEISRVGRPQALEVDSGKGMVDGNQGMSAAGLELHTAATNLLRAVCLIAERVEGRLVADGVGSTQQPQQLLSVCLKLAKAHKLQRLELSLYVLQNVRVAMDLVQDVGYEGAFSHLGRVLVGLSSRHRALCPTASSSSSSSQQLRPAFASKDSVWNLPPDQLARYMPQGDVPNAASDMPSDLPSDISDNACAPTLAHIFLDEGFLTGDFVRSLFQSGLATQPQVFPKFWTLLDFLLDQHNTGPYKGIVFLRTRQAVYYVADLIRRTTQLDFLQVFEFIGHGSKRAKNAPSAGSQESMERTPDDRHVKGMSGEAQEARLHAFKAPGCNLLIATSAAEEGLDVPTCEFVVRFHAAPTGIVRVQSRGRSRMLGSKFLCILQEHTLDSRLHAKSKEEESNMQALLASHRNKKTSQG